MTADRVARRATGTRSGSTAASAAAVAFSGTIARHHQNNRPPKHADYVADLARRLAEVGVSDVHTEAVRMRRWTPSRWELAVDRTPVPLISFVSCSGATGPDGVTGVPSAEPAAKVIGVVEIPVAAFTAGSFDALDWDVPLLPAHDAGYDPDEPYERVSFSQDLMREALDRFRDAGAAGLVLVVDLPAEHLTDGYLLYDGIQNGQGVAVLRSAGHIPPVNVVTVACGAWSLLTAAVGTVSTCLTGPTNALLSASGERPRQYTAGIVCGLLAMVYGLLAPLVTGAMLATPVAFVATLGGLAMLRVLQAAFVTAFSFRSALGVLITFIVTVSDVSVWNVGAPFWGLVAGLAVSWLLDRPDRSDEDGAESPPTQSTGG